MTSPEGSAMDGLDPKARAAIARVREGGFRRVMLLGTADQMAGQTYRKPLAASGVLVLVPGPDDREVIDALACGDTGLRHQFRDIIGQGMEHGANAVLLACAELEPEVVALGLGVPVIVL